MMHRGDPATWRSARGEERRLYDYVVRDEFHYYADRERGVAWQIPFPSR